MAGGIRIQPYQPIGVATPAVPGGGYQQIDAGAGDFGQAMGRGLQQAGAQAGQAVKEYAAARLEEAGRDNEAAAKDADTAFNNQVRATLFDPEKGYFAARGNDATARAKPTLEAIDKLRADYMGRLANDDQKRMFRDVSGRRMEAVNDQVFRHSLVERDKARDQSSDARIAGAASDAALYSNDDQMLARSLGLVQGEVLDKAKRNGWDADTTKAEVRKEFSRIVLAAIDGAIDDNPARAQAIRQRYGNQLDGTVAARIDKALKESLTRRQSQDETDRIREGRAGVAVGGSFVRTGELPKQLFADESGGAMIPNALGSGAYGPVQFMPETWAAVRKANPGLNLPEDMKAATKDQHIAAGKALWKSNAEALDAAGYEASDAALYLAHRFGVEGAKAVFRADSKAVVGSLFPASWSTQNPDIAKTTVAQFIRNVEKRYGALAGGEIGPAAADDAKKPPIDPETNRPTLEWQLERARTIVDPDVRDATISRIRAQDGVDRAGVADRQNRAADQATLWLDGNRGKPIEDMPRAIWSNLPPKLQHAAREAARIGGKVETDVAVWLALKNMAVSPDPEVRREFAAKNPLEWRAILSDATIKEVHGWQQAIKNGDDVKLTELVTVHDQVKTYARLAGLDTTPKDTDKDAVKALAEFNMAAQRRFNEAERAQSKKLDHEGREAILKQMVIPVDLGTSVLGMGGTELRFKVQRLDQLSSKNRAAVTPWQAEVEKQGGGKPTEADLLAGFGAAKNYGVPMDEIPVAIAVLRRNRVPITDDAIGKYWILEKQRREVTRPKAPVR